MSSRPHVRNRFVLIGDLALTIVSVLGSFALRLDVSELPYYFPAALVMCAVALLVKIPTYYFFGLYRRLWVYASTNELRLITFAVTTASVLASGVMLLLIGFDLIKPGMPRSALGIDWLISLILIGGSRFVLRILAEQSSAQANAKTRHALILGAGDAGALVVRELQKTSQLNLIPVGFLDDDPAKQNHNIYGVTVIGKIDQLENLPKLTTISLAQLSVENASLLLAQAAQLAVNFVVRSRVGIPLNSFCSVTVRIASLKPCKNSRTIFHRSIFKQSLPMSAI
jgi:FlaA1/EpsC-like NDP-sugar epimerase